jgi:hypothetical protein
MTKLFLMKMNRVIFYTVFGLLHLFIFVFSIYMDNQQDNLDFLLFMRKKIWMLKYGSFILLILMVVNVILHYRDNRRNLLETEKLNNELVHLKAKLYDLQEAARTTEDRSEEKRSL